MVAVRSNSDRILISLFPLPTTVELPTISFQSQFGGVLTVPLRILERGCAVWPDRAGGLAGQSYRQLRDAILDERLRLGEALAREGTNRYAFYMRDETLPATSENSPLPTGEGHMQTIRKRLDHRKIQTSLRYAEHSDRACTARK